MLRLTDGQFISLIGLGITALAATNIDDIVVLMVFFSNSNFSAQNIVIGQYLGIELKSWHITIVGVVIRLKLSFINCRTLPACQRVIGRSMEL
jgi:cadmium resistance protein CadD (predicted permease)